MFAVDAQQINVSIFNADNGLPQSQVNCLYQDSYGFLWVGTQDGLSCYDGYTFKIFSHNPIDTLSIANNYIYSIAEDNDRNLWIGTRGGVSMYRRAEANFTNYYFDLSNSKSHTNTGVYNVLLDKSGTIWLKTVDALHRFNAKTREFKQFPHFNNVFNSPSEFDISPLIEDSNGTIWLGSKDGLFRFDRETNEFTQIIIGGSFRDASNRVISIFEDSRGTFWVGTEGGLFVCDRTKNKCSEYVNSISNRKLTGNIVEFIGEDFDGTIWFGTENGITLLEQNGRMRNVTEVVSNGNVIHLTDVVSVIRDKSKVLWIGGQTGLVKWSYYNQRFKSFSKDKDGMNLFANNIVASILTEADGTIWVGTWGTGLFRFNPVQGTMLVFRSNKETQKISDDFIHVLFKKKNGELLAGTRNGILVYNENTKQFKELRPSGNKNIFRNNRIYAIDEDAEGNLWVATRVGLHFVKTNGEVRSFLPNSSDSLNILSSEVRDVIVDSEGFIWVATSNGLNCIHPSLKAIDNYTKAKRYNGKSLNTNDLFCLHEDKNGNIWVGTSAGIHLFDKKTKVFSIFTDNRNLVNGLVYAIEEDNNGRIWLSTNRGIVLLNAQANFTRGFSTNDGLLNNEFNLGASYKSEDGTMYFGTISGFNFFNPDSLRLNYEHPQVAITRIEVMGKNGEMQEIPSTSSKIKVTEGFKFLNLEFTSLDFNFPERNEYRYKIEGYDDRWNEIGSKHSVSFTNLEERTYLFKVMGSNSDRVWSKDPEVLKIVVTAPLWRSKIAIVIYIIIGLSFVSAYVGYRNRNLSKINKLLKEREFVLNELEDQKEVLEVSNKSITDSIHYAKRIQEAIMPSINVFKSILPDSFILYMPKDIVSGDFYWINETHNKTFIAAVDCTGHGVPGAFMSIIGIELLRNITSIEGVDDAAEILNKLSVSIYETFSSGINEEGVKVKDGMDVAFCVIDREYNVLQYAGAFSNMYLVREGKLIEINGDRYSVGTTTDEGNMLFSSHYVPLQPNDMIYILTDGYVDQFGGIEGKKFKLRRFRHLLLNMHRLPLEMQRKYLYDTITTWKGMQEQVDDILVIGIRPDLSCLF